MFLRVQFYSSGLFVFILPIFSVCISITLVFLNWGERSSPLGTHAAPLVLVTCISFYRGTNFLLILSCSVSDCVTCIPFVHSHILSDVCSSGNDSDVDLDRKEDEREKTPKRPRAQKTEKTPSTKETEQVSGAKNPIISVVLTAHEAIPGNQN